MPNFHFPMTQTYPRLIKIYDRSLQRRLKLKDIKDRCLRKDQQYRYYFKTASEGVEVYKELQDDTAVVPMHISRKIFCVLFKIDGIRFGRTLPLIPGFSRLCPKRVCKCKDQKPMPMPMTTRGQWPYRPAATRAMKY